MDLSSLPTLGARKSLDLGAVSRHERLSASGTTNSATGVANALLENFRATLGEAESYAALYEARVKVEEDYVRALKAIVDKQREMDLKVDQ